MSRGHRHKGAFVVEALAGPRYELALELFRSGRSFDFREVPLSIGEGGACLCIIDSSWGSKSTTTATATTDFEEAEATLRCILESSQEFALAVQGRPVRYELVDDYGDGSILLCSKAAGVVTWAYGFPRDA
jgi:hypothetical protein